jgi:hypothetical protein
MAKAKSKGIVEKKKKKTTPEERQELLEETRTLLKQWTRIREFLLMAFASGEVTRDDEQAFLELKSATARSQRVVSRKIPEDLAFGADKITDFLRQAISVSHLKGLPLADKRGLVGEWHVASVMLHRAVGALEYLAETQQEFVSRKEQARGIKAIKTEAAGLSRKNIWPMLLGTLLVAGVAGGLIYVLFFIL